MDLPELELLTSCGVPLNPGLATQPFTWSETGVRAPNLLMRMTEEGQIALDREILSFPRRLF